MSKPLIEKTLKKVVDKLKKICYNKYRNKERNDSMTKVTYEVTSKGFTTTVKTLADAQAIIRKHGGHYKAKYAPIYEKSAINPKRKRICLQ